MLEELFKQYKRVTESIISAIKIDVSIDEFFDKRECVIQQIESLGVSGHEKKKVYRDLGIDILDKNLEFLIKEELEKAKEDIRKNRDSKKIYSGYVSQNTVGNYFRRTI